MSVVLFLLAVPLFLPQNNQASNTSFSSLNYLWLGDSLGGFAPVSSFTYAPTIPTPGETITFDASASYDHDGTIVTYTWNFGEGNVTVATNPTITHSYSVDGNYTVELTVTDNEGLTGRASAIIQVNTEVFFRVVIYGTLTPLSNVNVTVYYKSGSTWVAVPTGPHGLEVRYDKTTQPNLANNASERYRNPATTATILRHDASNVGFDIHPASLWTVFFKFQWGPYVTYWPNETTQVFNYKDGEIESHDYLSGHQAYWDSTASTYVIHANDIAGHGVAPTSYHPIIVGIFSSPSLLKYYLTVQTSPPDITAIPGEGWYIKGTNVVLSAPLTIDVSSGSRYNFNYWDIDGVSKGAGINPITASMNANHTATAHYALQYGVTFDASGLSDATGTVVTIDGAIKTLADLPFTKWIGNGGSITYSYNTFIDSETSGKRFRIDSISGPTSPITVTAPATVTATYITQYSVTFEQTGLDTMATGTVLTINGVPKTYSQLPNMTWIDSGSSLTYSYSTYVSSTDSGKRFRLISVAGSSSPILVLAPMVVTADYTSQYSVIFSVIGLDSSSATFVVAIDGVAKTYSELPSIVWIDSGSSVTYSFSNMVLSAVPGKRFKQIGVIGPGSPIVVTGSVTVTGNYKVQYEVTFDQTGVGADFTGAVVSIDGVNFSVNALPNSSWWDSGSSHIFSFGSPLSGNSRQYTWSSASGLSGLRSGTLTVTGPGNVIGNYVVQNVITFDQIGVNSDFTGTILIVDGVSYNYSNLPVSFPWNLGTSHNFAFQSPLAVGTNHEQYVWTNTTGLANSQTGSITITAYGSVIGNYKTQYYLTLVGLSLAPTGAGWYDGGTFASVFTPQYGDIVTGSSRYSFSGWSTNDMSEITDPSSPTTTVFMDKPKTVTANYVIQYAITFSQSGVSSDFTGTILTIDGTEYTVSTLPTPILWWNNGSSHAFAFISPLIVNASKSYDWIFTTGLSALQSGSLKVASSGSITGNYVVHTKFQITFDVAGVSIDASGTIVTVDGVNYTLTSLPVSFWWDTASMHEYSFSTTIDAGFGKRYVLDHVTGLSRSAAGTIFVSRPGSVVGNYKTQYYLSLATNPAGVNSPSGSGWYDSGANATISTVAFVDIVPGSSRYRFNGWTTADMAEINSPTVSPAIVVVDKAKTVTANYAIQDYVTLGQSGIASDFTATVVTVDGVNYPRSGLPVSFWWDQDSPHTFTYQSPLVVTPDAKQYVWSSTSGLSSQRTESFTLTTYGSITGNYNTQYKLTVVSPFDTPNPVSGWFNPGTNITAFVTSPTPGTTGTQYVCVGWTGSGSVPVSGTGSSLTFVITSPSTITWAWKTQYYLIVKTSPSGVATITGQGWYDAYSSASLTAPPADGYDFQYWTVDGNVQGANITSVTVLMNSPHTAIAYYSISAAAPVGGRTVLFSKAAPIYLIIVYIVSIATFSAVSILTRRRKIIKSSFSTSISRNRAREQVP